MNSFEKMENNINMNYKDLIIILLSLIMFFLPIVLIISFILSRSIHLIVSANVKNSNAEIKVSFRCFFDLINITKTIYPISKDDNKQTNNQNKEEKGDSKKIDLKKIELENLLVIYRISKKIKISEIHSNLSYGSENIYFTSFIYVLINMFYGNIINYFNPEKMYLKVTPSYTKNYLEYTGLLHISPTISDLISLIRGILKIYIKIRKYKKVKYDKEDNSNEISKFNKKSNGYNT
ncbi:DUF2953 domain-containing protein [Paraclostridium sp.]|uniref:DUF2953 domain-containing protein n=1 Tax=Paraclostridium sp. TaxID=2023273 RepID=UPI003F66977A